MTNGRRALSQTIREEGKFIARDENDEKEIHNYEGEYFVIVEGEEEPTILLNEDFEMDKESLAMVNRIDISGSTVTIRTDETSMEYNLSDQEIDGWDELNDAEAKKMVVSSALSSDEEVGG